MLWWINCSTVHGITTHVNTPWKLSSVEQWGLIVSVRVLITSVTSSLLPANADVKNVWNVISTYTFTHNVRVYSWNTKFKLIQILNLSLALWFVTTRWFWKMALLVSWSTKIRIRHFLSWQYEAENQSLSLLLEAGPACKMLTSNKSLIGRKNSVLISL